MSLSSQCSHALSPPPCPLPACSTGEPLQTPIAPLGTLRPRPCFFQSSLQIYLMSAAERRGEQEKHILQVPVCLQVIRFSPGSPRALSSAKYSLGEVFGCKHGQGKAKPLWALGDHRGGIWAGNRKAFFPPPGRHPVGTETILAAGHFLKARIDVYRQESEERKKLSTPLFATNNFTFSSRVAQPGSLPALSYCTSQTSNYTAPTQCSLDPSRTRACFLSPLRSFLTPGALGPRRPDPSSAFAAELPL